MHFHICLISILPFGVLVLVFKVAHYHFEEQKFEFGILPLWKSTLSRNTHTTMLSTLALRVMIGHNPCLFLGIEYLWSSESYSNCIIYNFCSQNSSLRYCAIKPTMTKLSTSWTFFTQIQQIFRHHISRGPRTWRKICLFFFFVYLFLVRWSDDGVGGRRRGRICV